MKRRHSQILSLFAAGSLAVLVVPAGSAGAVEGAFSATGSASGIHMQFSVPGAPLQDTVIDAGGPTARVLLDSLGTSRGYASFPFPGEIPAAGPGIVRGLTPLPVPDYPLYQASFHPSTPKSRFSGMGTNLESTSDPDSSRSTAESAGMATGPDGDQGFGIARSHSSAVRTEDALEALATSELTAVRVGPLNIAQVRSMARVVIDSDGRRVRTSELRITGAEVNGEAVSITGDGIVAQGQPVPGTTPVPLQQALAGSGVNVVVSAPTRTAHGITSPALQITRKMDSGETLTATVALASAAIENAGAVDADSAGAGTDTPATDAAPADESPGPAFEAPASESGTDPAPAPTASSAAMTAAPPTMTVPATEPMRGLLNEVGLDATPSTSSPATTFSGPLEAAAPAFSAPSLDLPPAPRAAPATAARKTLPLAPLAHELVNRTSSTPAGFGVLVAGSLAAIGLVGALTRKPREARNS